jgi:4-amino-4-deoxy-L-arabinose transferase-like glycosyltransferase
MPKLILAGCILAYVVVIGFLLPSPAKYHGDERFYTDAALLMCDSGDYWTPRYPDGRVRLLKPIAAYWPIAASFKAFGVSLVSSRLPSLAAGALSLFFVFQLGRTVFRSDHVGALAALILVSNVEFLTISARATPDLQVTFWVLISALGFAKVWFEPVPSRAGPFLAWIGMGLAVQTKGLLGLCPLAANLLFLWMAPPDQARQRLRTLLDFRAVLIGLALGLFWYVVMFRTHGPSALRDFFNDQVGAKVSISPLFIAGNLFSYALSGVRHLLPWTALLAVGLLLGRKRLAAFWREHRSVCIFLLVLFPFLVVAFSFGNMRRSRYLMISYPMLAVLVAGLLDAWGRHEGLQKVLARLILFFSGFLAVSGVAVAGAAIWLGWRMGFAGVLMFALGLAGLAVNRSSRVGPRWCWVAALVMVFVAVFDGAIRPISTPTPLGEVARLLAAKGASGKTVYTLGVEDITASQLRMMANNRIKVQPLKPAKSSASPEFILTTAAARGDLSQEVYEFHRVEMDPQTIKIRDTLRPLARKEKSSRPSRRNTEYWVAVRRG